MNEKIKNTLLVTLVILLLSACGGLETAPASVDTPEPAVTEEPTSVPEPVIVSDPVEDVPTTVPSDGADSEQFNKYIGLIYPPSPENLTQVFSMLIHGKEDHSLMMVLEGGNKMLWLNKIDHYDENGSAFWEVKDVLVLSNVEPGLTLLPDGCSLNGVPDSEIFVAGRNEVIVLAWRANTTSNVFEVIPVTGIECRSDKGISLE